MSSCSRHAGKEAVGACKNCGKLVCKLCHKEKDGLSYCQVCYDNLFPATEAQSATSVITAAPAVQHSSPPAKISKADPEPVLHAVMSTEPDAQQEKTIVTVLSKGQAGISWAWWILPVVMGWIGGLISWLLNKSREPKTARYMLFGGIGVTITQLFMVFLIIFAAIAPGAQVPVVNLKSAAPTVLNVPAANTWTEKATAENGTTIRNAGISLQVPPGAVKSDTEIVIKEFTDLPPEFYYAESVEPPPMAMALSNVYDVGPGGIQFDKPVQVTIPYDKTQLPAGAKPEDIKMAHWDGNNWVVVGGHVDANKGTVTISAANFPGSALGLIIGGSVVIGGLILYFKNTGDPRAKGTAPEHVMPTDNTVIDYTARAVIRDEKNKTWVPLEDPQHPGRLNPEVMTASSPLKQIGYKERSEQPGANMPNYRKFVAGADTNWTKPDIYFNKLDQYGNPIGDCTCITSANLSILRRLGVEAYGVDGEHRDPSNGNKWTEHTWIEFVYQGKPYYYDNDEGIKPLQDVKGYIRVNSSTLGNKGFMWNEKEQKWYRDAWWKEENTPVVTIKPPGSSGVINKPYTFVARPENMPAGSKIEWYFSGGPDEKAAVYKDKETITHEFKSGGQKTVTVQYMQGNTKVAGDEVAFFVQGKASLDILLPPPASTAGLPLDPDKPNTFTAIPEGVPLDAVYSWFINGAKMDEGVNKTTLTIPAESLKPSEASYQVKLLVNWTGGDKKNKGLAASKDFFVDTRSLYIAGDFPKSGIGKYCTPYFFSAKYGDKQPGTNFEWFENGEQIGSGRDSITHTFKSYGPKLISVKATRPAESNAPPVSAYYSVEIKAPKLTLKGPKELKDGEKATIWELYTFWLEGENIPDGATLTIENMPITIGEELQFRVHDVTQQVMNASASWDNDGCKGTALSYMVVFDVGEPTIDKITATPTPGAANKQTTFKASGKYIPKEITLVWEPGKDELGQNSTSMEKAIYHTYKAAGPYTVKVTLFDKSNHKWASKEMEYTVAEGPTLTLDMPHSGPEDKEYTFIARPDGIPKGALYTWAIDGDQVLQGTDKTTYKSKPNDFKAGNSYKFHVVVTWAEKTAAGQTINQSIDANASFQTELGEPSLYIKVPGDGNAISRDRKNVFYAVPTNIPGDADYTWFISEGLVKTGRGEDGSVFTADPGFFKKHDYTMQIFARWKVNDAPETISADAAFTVDEEVKEPYVNIDANPSVGATKELAVFSLSGGNIPDGCGFSWNFGDPKKGGAYSTGSLGEPSSHIYDEPGTYTVRASVLVKKTGRVLTSREISYKVVTPTITASLPVINSFKTSAGTVANNSCITLTWNVSGADNVEISPGSISVANTGSKKVCPTADTRYVMTASNKVGKVTSPGVSVRVVEIAMPPVINSFIAGAPSCCYISWDVSGADTIIITPGSSTVAASGSKTACPTNDTTYILTATNGAGSVSGRVFIKGTTPAPAPAPAATPTTTPTPGPAPTPAPTPSTATEEVTFYVYREVTTTFSDKSVEKSKEACQSFSVTIYRVEGMKETFIPASSNSIARNGSYSIVLPVGHYKYKINGTYNDPDGYAGGSAGFDVVKGGRNFVEVVDYASRRFK